MQMLDSDLLFTLTAQISKRAVRLCQLSSKETKVKSCEIDTYIYSLFLKPGIIIRSFYLDLFPLEACIYALLKQRIILL